MAYSPQLLTLFSQVPHYIANENARKFTDFYSKKECKSCYYRILPLGTYDLDSEAKISHLERIHSYSIPLIHGLAGCLAVYGLFKASPLMFALGSVPLAFKAKDVTRTAVGLAICPAALSGLHRKFPKIIPSTFYGRYLVERQQAHALITGLYESDYVTGYHVTNIRITKNGVTYDAYFITSQGGPENLKRWMIHALEGNEVPGNALNDYPLDYCDLMEYKAFNHVIVAGPSVGHSTGWPNAQTIGNGYSAAMQLLEQMGATHLVMEARGFFGGLTLAKAIEVHDFQAGKQREVSYLALSISTPSSVAEVAKQTKAGRLAEMIVKLCDMNINCEKMNQKLSEMDITHLVVGHEDPMSPFDGIVSDQASLYHQLRNKAVSNVKLIKQKNKLAENRSDYWQQAKSKVVKEEFDNFFEARD